MMSQSNGSKPLVYMTMPSADGTLTYRAAVALLVRATKHQSLTPHVNGLASSAVVANMNDGLCGAIEMHRNGKAVSYFAMLHNDIEPEDWWLDRLVELLEEKDLDVLSVISPIKDPRGLSSTAVGYPDLEDRFRVQYRITMKEVFDLPETFTADDLTREKGPLLVNNGCFVMKFRPEWAERDPDSPHGYCGPYFNLESYIGWDERRGKFTTAFSPEDWAIARQYHRMGLKVGCTRAIKLGHKGVHTFGNAYAWGDDEVDKQNRPEPALTTLEV